MIWWFVIVYALFGAMAGTEVALRMRDVVQANGYKFRFEPDAEDIGVMVLAGVFWPLTLAVLAWFHVYVWRKGRVRGPESEG